LKHRFVTVPKQVSKTIHSHVAKRIIIGVKLENIN
jgi:hypothetical protein